MATRFGYDDIRPYPANRYIQTSPFARNPYAAPPLAFRQPATPGAPAPAQPTEQPGAGGGWWKPTWSPELMEGMYSQPGSLAAKYQGFLDKNPMLEQMEFNRAMERVRGQHGGLTKQLMDVLGTRTGGWQSGAMQAGMRDIGSELLRGTTEISTAQAIKNLTEAEERRRTLLGYEQQDIANRGGWMDRMMGFEQWGQGAEEQFNAQRREEQMGWANMLMQYLSNMAQQYYAGQGNWLDYTGMRGGNILEGYGPQWAQTIWG